MPRSVDQLSVGDVTEVGGREYSIVCKIGQGAYGKIWLVHGRDDSEQDDFVLKVTTANSNDAKAQEANLFEVMMLKHLTKNLSEEIKDLGRVPLYLDHTTEEVSGKECVACLMTRVEGNQLDHWLYGVGEEARKTMDVKRLIHGRLPGGKVSTMRFDVATSVAISLLAQLAPVLSTLQSSAFHRDISCHNILVDVPNEKASQHVDFSLIDFGLAVSTKTWGIQAWKTSNISGDARYWTPGAWMNVGLGSQHLENHRNKGHLRQYQERLDHFSMGILALEVAFALWDGNDDSDLGGPLESVHTSWCKFWKLVLETHCQFWYSADTSVEKRKKVAKQTVGSLDVELQQLRTELRNFAKDIPHHDAATLFTVCADLIDEWGTLTWIQVSSTFEDLRRKGSKLSYTSEVPRSRVSSACTDDMDEVAFSDRRRNRLSSDWTLYSQEVQEKRSRNSSDVSAYTDVSETDGEARTCETVTCRKNEFCVIQ